MKTIVTPLKIGNPRYELVKINTPYSLSSTLLSSVPRLAQHSTPSEVGLDLAELVSGGVDGRVWGGASLGRRESVNGVVLADLRSAKRRVWGGTSLGRWESVNGVVLADLRSAYVKVYRGWHHPVAVKSAGNTGTT
ncbi:hypothetical protein GYMLUDRAFT_246424 [Collybiopsis luxurians FD-317 M1]|uniref:Uncharacterized protein n=1 Tax=Collybiopsis luxurians FD-317 M1 TaxID=944289 RepID=A0A0D0C6D7_9AGAR|nr:hypothetical protein GYMLUDRAFT_246424 [Collybiopsis luxurians FD-317 M1]